MNDQWFIGLPELFLHGAAVKLVDAGVDNCVLANSCSLVRSSPDGIEQFLTLCTRGLVLAAALPDVDIPLWKQPYMVNIMKRVVSNK